MGRIAAKPRSQQWSKFSNENHQKLTFREGVQPGDLARFSRRIESYRFIMESSKSKPYSANYDFLAWCQAGSGSQHLLQIYADLKSVQICTDLCRSVHIWADLCRFAHISGYLHTGGWGGSRTPYPVVAIARRLMGV